MSPPKLTQLAAMPWSRLTKSAQGAMGNDFWVVIAELKLTYQNGCACIYIDICDNYGFPNIVSQIKVLNSHPDFGCDIVHV